MFLHFSSNNIVFIYLYETQIQVLTQHGEAFSHAQLQDREEASSVQLSEKQKQKETA